MPNYNSTVIWVNILLAILGIPLILASVGYSFCHASTVAIAMTIVLLIFIAMRHFYKKTKVQSDCLVSATLIVPSLSIVPLVIAFLQSPKHSRTNIHGEFSESDFLAIILGMAAYLGAVRMALVQRLGVTGEGRSRNPDTVQCWVLLLIPADFNLILCGIVMISRGFFPGFHSSSWTSLLEPGVAFGFTYTVCYLACMHVAAWIISFRYVLLDKPEPASPPLKDRGQASELNPS